VAAHLAIATRLCDSIIAAPSHASVKVWAKLLHQVRVDNTVDLEELCALVKQAQAAASGAGEPAAVTAIGKFAKSLEEVCDDDAGEAAGKKKKAGDEDEDEEEEEEAEAHADDDKKKKKKSAEEEEEDAEAPVEDKKKRKNKAAEEDEAVAGNKMLALDIKGSKDAAAEGVGEEEVEKGARLAKQRELGGDVSLGGLFGHADVPLNSKAAANKKKSVGARRTGAIRDDDHPVGGLCV